MNAPQIPQDGRVVSPECRLIYPVLAEPKTSKFKPDADPKYSVIMLWPKSVDLTALGAICDAAAKSKWGDPLPKTLEFPFNDGDQKDREDYQNHWYARASSRFQPQVVDCNRQPVIDYRDVYSGVYALVSLTAWTSGGPGTPFTPRVNFNLGNILVTRNGDRVGGQSVSADQDFANVTVPQNAEPLAAQSQDPTKPPSASTPSFVQSPQSTPNKGGYGW